MADMKKAAAVHRVMAGQPTRKQGKEFVKQVQDRIKLVQTRLDEETEAMKRGETRLEDLAWETELEPSHHRKRR